MARCPICGEGLTRYHVTEIECRHCGQTYCPTHRRPEAHDCEATSEGTAGTFGFEEPRGTRTTPPGAADRDRVGAGSHDHTDQHRAVRRDRRVVSLLMLVVFLANIPLSYTGPLAAHHFPTEILLVTGGLIVGYAFSTWVMGRGYHTWANVRGGILVVTLVLVLAGLSGGYYSTVGTIDSARASVLLVTGAPVVVYVGYRLAWMVLDR